MDLALRFRFAKIGFQSIETCHNSINIAIHGCNRLPIRDTGYSSRCVGTDPCEYLQTCCRFGKLSAHLVANGVGGLMHMDRSAIIPKALPKFHQIIETCISKITDGWKAGQKSLIIGNNRHHPCLLQHNFRYPDGIGIACLTPGQFTTVDVIPVQKIVGRKCLFHQTWILASYFL